jgi:predicted MFS family arabinose efflux permease
VSSLAAFALWYPPGRLSTMSGVAFASGILGAIAATVPLELLLRSLGWREVFMGVVGLTVAASLLLYAVVPEKAVARRALPLGRQLRELAAIGRDPAFWRLAGCVCTSQLAAVSLSTLWVAAWLRDVAGYTQAEVARALLVFNIVMMFSYLGFGRAADALVRRGVSSLPLMAGGVGAASVCLALLALGVRTGHLVLWSLFFACASTVVQSYSLYSRRHPPEMAGRANGALNVWVFVGMFSGQWVVGLILHAWPETATGYAPEAYTWALGLLWLLQVAGLAWLWAGRRYFTSPRTG